MDPNIYITQLQQQIKELEEQVKQTRLEAEIATHSKTMFLANMSHEIRTPMNSIIGIYNLLSQTKLTPEQAELLEIINISSHNLLAIINDILDHSKMESGQLKLEYRPFHLVDEINQVIKLLSIKAKGKGIELHSRIESSVPTCLLGDAFRLRQILINLTNNAIKFTIEGQVTLSVEKIPLTEDSWKLNANIIPEYLSSPDDLQKDHCLLLFRITDTGIGISPEEQSRLFNEYAQVESHLIKRYEGTGLGLSISRNLTSMMKGRIGVNSIQGKGSDFWITIPFQRSSSDCLEKVNQRSAGARPSRNLHILIVEDNLLNQKFALTSLRKEGHKVDIAENGKIAVELFCKNVYDLILMDIAMPIMDGLEATRIIRTMEKEHNVPPGASGHVKIIAVTAHVMVTDRMKCLSVGMDDYLAKPFRPADLIAIINNLNFD